MRTRVLGRATRRLIRSEEGSVGDLLVVVIRPRARLTGQKGRITNVFLKVRPRFRDHQTHFNATTSPGRKESL